MGQRGAEVVPMPGVLTSKLLQSTVET
eukprot:COSAG06_NODE_36360_length_448_cov_0.593123_1_plen_26_part_10